MDTQTPIDLMTQVQEGQIDLTKQPLNILPPEVANLRATKASIALQDRSPGVDQLAARLMAGEEPVLRQEMARDRDIEHRKLQLSVVEELAGRRAREGKSLSEDEIGYIRSLSEQDLRHNPDTILETEFARSYFNKVTELRGGENIVTQGVRKQPDDTMLEMDVVSNVKSRQEIVKTRLENMQEEWKNTGWGEALLSHASRFVPLLENSRLHDAVKDAPTVSFMPGTNLQEQVKYLWALPPQEFSRQFNAAVDELNSKNKVTAQVFAHAVLQFSNSDQYLQNVLGLVDASSVIPGPTLIGKGVAASGKVTSQGIKDAALIAKGKSLEKFNDIKTALRDTLKADGAAKPAPLEKVVEAAGDVEKAAEITAYKDALSTFRGQDPLSDRARLTSEVPSIFNVDKILEGSKDLGREAATRLTNVLSKNAASLLGAVTDTGRVIALEGEALQTAIRSSQDKLRGAYPRLNDAVLGMNHVAAESNAANAHLVEMQLGKSAGARKSMQTDTEAALEAKTVPEVEVNVGKPDATLFGKRDEADYWAREIYKLNTGEYRIGQQGVGFHISVRAPVDVTEDAVRDKLIETRHVTPSGWSQTFFGRLKTNEDLLAEGNRENRHIATHGAQEVHRLAVEAAKEITALRGTFSNKSIKKLNRFLEANRDETYQEGDKLRRGVFYQNVGEFDKAWMDFHKVAPTEQERIAYFTAIQLNDWQYVFENLSLYRDKSRLGIEQHRFTHKVLDETTGESAMVKSNYVEGRVEKDLPWQDPDDAGIWFYDGKTNSGQFIRKNGMTGTDRATLESRIKEGYKVIQVANPVQRELKGVTGSDEVINYIVVPASDRKALSWDQIAYRPGGHVEYMHGHWTKQPVIRTTEDGRRIYEGDETVFNHATQAEAVKFSSAMDTARVLMNEDKIVELEEFLAKNLPYDRAEFEALFSEKTLPNGQTVPARFQKDQPFRNTTSGQNVLDIHKDLETAGLENLIRSKYNLYGQIDKKYTSERNSTVMTVKERMEGANPVFKLEEARLMDPLSTMNRGMAHVMRSRYLNDYKLASVEKFVEEFSDLFTGGGVTKDMVRKDPIYYLHNAKWNDQWTDKQQLAAGKNAQRGILQLLGTESELGGNLRHMQEGLLNFIYSKGGQKASDYVADHFLPVTQDPFRYARAVAFHSKLGLFNPVQIWLQAQTLTHVAAVSGIDNGLKGMSAATLMRRLALTNDPKVIEHFGEMAVKMGWKKEDFIESYNALKKSGVYNVEGEHAFRDDFFDPKLFKGSVGSFLDKGTFFFREGERLVRLTAWNAAYREWKVANPTAALNNAALAKILNRQNTLSVNMTRASAAWWQNGLMSVPTQFFSYQARLMEQFLGKRLTGEEKARALMTYSAMYGVPTTIGATTFAWPWYEDIRQAALERGIDPNAPGMKALMDGIPSQAMALLGMDYNFSERYGPGGVKYFKEVFQKGKVENIFGASPKIAMQMAGAVAPIFKSVISPFVPGMADWKFTTADAVTALEEVSTLNNVGKALYAANFGKFISKNEINLGDASGTDAFMTAVFGVQPTRLTDAFIISEMRQEQKNTQEAVKKEVVKNYRRAIREFSLGNDSAAQKLMQNAYLQLQGGDFLPTERVQVMQEAFKGHESFIDKMNQEYIMNAPASQYRARVNKLFPTKPLE